MEKILITGANGFLGQHLTLWLAGLGYHVIATGRGDCRIPNAAYEYYSADLTQKDEVKLLLALTSPDIIIHNAAMSKPDECERFQDLCLLNNVESTQFLLDYGCRQFIYISTDFVFGEDGPHGEDDTPAPLNFYGTSKLMAEQLVAQSGHLYTIVRPVFMYGKVWDGMKPTFIHWVKNALNEARPIKVVSDQARTPTYVPDICLGLQRIIERRAGGVFHLAGAEVLSPYQMAIWTGELLGLDISLIESVTAETFPEPVKRARRSGLTITRAIQELAFHPVPFEQGVKLTFGLIG